MRIQTPLLGEIEINQQQIVHFEHGLPGFEQETEFIFLSLEESLFILMQSIRSSLYFVVINPFAMFPDYDFELSPGDLKQLEIECEEEILVYNIVVIREEMSRSTVNMQAPLILNTRTMKGKQIILNQYQVKQPLFPSGIHVTNR